MHIHKYADIASFDEIAAGGTIPATDVFREFIKKLHPKQFLDTRISVPMFEVTFDYITNRGNCRTRKKYVILNHMHEQYDLEIEMKFMDWVNHFNQEHPFRKISNVQILDIKPLAYANIYVG